jgi:two-component system NtrC family sensor kinase
MMGKMRVLLQHPELDEGSRQRLAALYELYLDPADAPSSGVDAVVVHPSLEGWPRVVHRLRRDHQSAVLIAWVEQLAQATTAVNDLRARCVIHDLSELIVQLAKLAPVAPTESQEFEIRVQERTQALQQIKAQWEQSFDAVLDPMAVMDEHFRLIRVNRAYATHLGLPIVNIPGRFCYELQQAYEAGLVEQEQPENGRCLCQNCPVRSSSGMPKRATLIDKKGQRWAVAAYPISVADQPQSFVVHYRDITQAVQRLDRVARANKMAAVGSLAGAIAHQLNSPMTSIMVFSEALSRKTDPDSELHENAKEINDSAQRCRRLIQGLLRFARRPRAAQLEPVGLARVIAEMQPLVQHRVDVARVSLEVDVAMDSPLISGRHSDVEHLLVDLIVNALEACSPGDTISVWTESKPGHVQLCVKDSGRGMSEDVLASAFTPFFSTKQNDQGAGLGLTTCEAIVSEMGGTITLESRLGEGSCATLMLPVWTD